MAKTGVGVENVLFSQNRKLLMMGMSIKTEIDWYFGTLSIRPIRRHLLGLSPVSINSVESQIRDFNLTLILSREFTSSRGNSP